jgi:hypothetical protein
LQGHVGVAAMRNGQPASMALRCPPGPSGDGWLTTAGIAQACITLPLQGTENPHWQAARPPLHSMGLNKFDIRYRPGASVFPASQFNSAGVSVRAIAASSGNP